MLSCPKACEILIPRAGVEPVSLHWDYPDAMQEPLLSVQENAGDSLQPHGLQPTRLLCPWDAPGKSTGVGCCALPQGIFLTQGLTL